jgi:hypothetical protein
VKSAAKGALKSPVPVGELAEALRRAAKRCRRAI